MSPSGEVITRDVYPAPAALVWAVTVLAPTSSAFAVFVVKAPLSLVVDAPAAPMAVSNGFAESIPRYSAMRTSGAEAAPLNVTVTEFAPAAAAAMFFA
jgi:hypothetical protein